MLVGIWWSHPGLYGWWWNFQAVVIRTPGSIDPFLLLFFPFLISSLWLSFFFFFLLLPLFSLTFLPSFSLSFSFILSIFPFSSLFLFFPLKTNPLPFSSTLLFSPNPAHLFIIPSGLCFLAPLLPFHVVLSLQTACLSKACCSLPYPTALHRALWNSFLGTLTSPLFTPWWCPIDLGMEGFRRVWNQVWEMSLWVFQASHVQGHSPFPVPAFITTSAFNKERTRQAASPQWSTDTEDAG